MKRTSEEISNIAVGTTNHPSMKVREIYDVGVFDVMGSTFYRVYSSPRRQVRGSDAVLVVNDALWRGAF